VVISDGIRNRRGDLGKLHIRNFHEKICYKRALWIRRKEERKKLLHASVDLHGKGSGCQRE